jgi:hypothetical protein
MNGSQMARLVRVRPAWILIFRREVAYLHICPAYTYLQGLSCADDDMSAAFARDVLLPAVRANTSLRAFYAGAVHDAAVEAKALVDARAAAHNAG